jgi:hypothetical protein
MPENRRRKGMPNVGRHPGNKEEMINERPSSRT